MLPCLLLLTEKSIINSFGSVDDKILNVSMDFCVHPAYKSVGK